MAPRFVEMNAISITALVKSYGKVTALQGIDLTVPQGMIYGVVGPNGAGKTTLIKALVGVARPPSGTTRILGGYICALLIIASRTLKETD